MRKRIAMVLLGLSLAVGTPAATNMFPTVSAQTVQAAGKTGWTEEAGHTLVTIAERDGVTLICIVMHSDGVVDAQYIDSTAILDYGFDNYTRAVVSKDRVEPKTMLLTGSEGMQQEVRLTRTEDMPVLLPAGVTVDDL
mgnify:CR=1 FL=1